jgi:O-antigen/teichoic acid export membrane protein
MANLKTLAKDTAIYGLSSIVGRFLNYCLVPLHTWKISAESGGYGIVSNLYAWSALLFVLLTFGMETTFFRFSNKDGEDERMVFSTALRLVGGVGIAFVIFVLCLLHPISGAMGYAAHPEYIACFAVIGALDAFQAILFARLRQQHRPLKFMKLKMLFIILNIILNLIIFLVLPLFFHRFPGVQAFYEHFNYGVGLIFFANLFCTFIVTFGFLKELKGITFGFDGKLARRMLKYAWPILLLGLVGILGQVFDKMAFPRLMPGEEGFVQLGIYGACVKIAMIMSLLTQAFRYAYEPFVFGGAKDKNSPQMLAVGMKYFLIFALLAFLAVVFYMPILKYLVVNHDYWEGLRVVPIVMAGEIFMGVYFNLSFWYKLTDQTWWGAIMSAIGAAVMIGINVLFVPRIGYMACAWGIFGGYAVSMLLSYFIGQKKYPIRYPLKEIGIYVLFTIALFCCSIVTARMKVWLQLSINTLLLLLFCAYILKKDLPLKSIPVLKRFAGK